MIFEKNFKVLYHDTDVCGVILPSRLLVYMQETAQAQTMSIGAGADEMRDRDNAAFWLTRICFDMIKPIKAYDEIKVETWGANDSRGFSFTRCFRVTCKGEIIALGYSVWALMNIEKMCPIPVKDWNAGLELEDPIKPSAPLHVRLPKELEYAQGGSHTVSYGDIDANGHMNNTRYPDLLCGFLPPDAMDGKCICELSLSYLHEAAKGSVINAKFARDPRDENVYYVRTVLEGTGDVNAEAIIKLRKL